MMKRLAVVTSHPIQYNAPLFKYLSQSGKVALKVFYTWEQSNTGLKYDPGFNKYIEWDIPLLEGYEYEFVKNISSKPGSEHFRGIINPDLIDKIKAWEPDALLVYGWAFVSHLKCIRAFHGKIPVLFRGDSTLLNEKRGLKLLLRRTFLRWVYAHVDYALYAGINNKNYFSTHGLKEKQLVFAPHAIDNARFSHQAEGKISEAYALRRTLGIDDNDILLLFAGKLEQVKNPWVLLRLAAKLSANQYKFLFVGNGHLEKDLKTASAQDNRIKFLDFQNQARMPVIYHMADIFILPSFSETWGLAVNEAMACSVPVLISNKCGCAPDLIREGVNGYVFDYDKVDELYQKVQELGNKGKKGLKQMGEASRKIVGRYTIEAVSEAIEKILYGAA